MKLRIWTILPSLIFMGAASLPVNAQDYRGTQDRPQIQPPRPSPGKPQPPRPPRPQPPRPPVVMRESLTLYASPSWRGASVRFTGSASSLGRYGFDNRAQSLRVIGRWQVCDRPRYHGACRIVTGSQSHLVRIGLNGRISSVRYLGR